MNRHTLEDADSWQAHADRLQQSIDVRPMMKQDEHEEQDSSHHRQLKHHHKHHLANNAASLLEQAREDEYHLQQRRYADEATRLRAKMQRKRQERMHELLANPGVAKHTVHGIMIDAGSTGSRLHIYEWEPRVLSAVPDIEAAVSGTKLSFPGTESRWTDRLRPGLASFADIANDDELRKAVAQYLLPLLEFAKTVLNQKQEMLGDYPIFLRATAGMRILEPADRARVMRAVRDLFADKTYCPFYFVDEQARVLSGEEEAIYDWTGVNFLLGNLIETSQGAGTVVEPRLTHGAIDLGGGSTQIAFFEPNEDIMSSLFKLQIGQAKHWNLYAHSFLFYGMNEAINRFYAELASGKSTEERMVDGIYNPCLPGGAEHQVRTDIHTTKNGNGVAVETWKYNESFPSGNGNYQAVLRNDDERGNPEKCLDLAKNLLHLEKNDWCNFAHKGDCSLAGIYQPELPSRANTPNFGEFVAFSNYYHIWKFLQLPERATIAQLKNATEYACSLSADELMAFNNGSIETSEELNSYCFRSAYAFQLLHNGYGFQMNDTIRATRVINGQKVGWALGAMLYEINAMPWEYKPKGTDYLVGVDGDSSSDHISLMSAFLLTIVVGVVLSLVFVLRHRHRFNKQLSARYQYEEIRTLSI